MGKPDVLIDYNEGANQYSFIVKKPHLEYLNSFIALKCAPDLLDLKVFPNAKEITESMGAFRAVVKQLGYHKLGDPSICCIVVGDGSTPRTGALFAFRSRWDVFSIDPAMRTQCERFDRIKRLTMFKGPLKEFKRPRGYSQYVVVAVHSHASKQETIDFLYEGHSSPPYGKSDPPPSIDFRPLLAVTIPCCLANDPYTSPITYTDWGIQSPKRTVNIWRWP